MATFNKQSVREEFDSIKDSFHKLSKENKIPKESASLFKALFLLFELILSVFLEKQTKKDSKNSSIPPSQTDKDESSTSSKGAKSKGKDSEKKTINNSRTIETVDIIELNQCEKCGESLRDVDCKCYERRTKIDIVFEKTIEHIDVEIKDCPNCHSEVKAKHPNDMSGPMQYGNGLKAYIINLIVAQMIPLKRTQKMIEALIGNLISQATFLTYIMNLYMALESWEKSSIETLLQSPCINSDETSMRVDKKNHWVHVYSAGEITLKFLHKNRGKKAMEDIGIIPRYGGDVVHDCWASYLSYVHCGHGLCGSHLLRDLTFVIDSNQYKWAKNIKALLQETCKKVSSSKKKKLSKKEYASLQRRYRNILTRGEKEMPSIPNRTKGKRGKIAKSDAHNLLERLVEHETAVLLFAKKAEVSFTNNRAERDLRMNKVKQKISGCFRVEKYAHAFCRISSYLITMSNKGVNPLIAIQMALSGEVKED